MCKMCCPPLGLLCLQSDVRRRRFGRPELHLSPQEGRPPRSLVPVVDRETRFVALGVVVSHLARRTFGVVFVTFEHLRTSSALEKIHI